MGYPEPLPVDAPDPTVVGTPFNDVKLAVASIHTELGTSPKGAWASVHDRLAGLVVARTNADPPGARVSVAGTVTELHARVAEAPTGLGSSISVTLRKNGTIAASVTIAADALSGSTTGLGVAVAIGDVLTYDVTAVGDTFPGRHLAVDVVTV